MIETIYFLRRRRVLDAHALHQLWRGQHAELKADAAGVIDSKRSVLIFAASDVPLDRSAP